VIEPKIDSMLVTIFKL